MDVRACPVCAVPFDSSWPVLAARAGAEPVASHVCPGCTTSWTGRPWFRDATGYRARVCTSDAAAAIEDDDGRIRVATGDTHRRIVLSRASDVLRAIDDVQSHRRIRLLQIGTRDAEPVALAVRQRRVNPMALEPWRPWANAARELGIDAQPQVLEQWKRRGSFDVIVEHDLLPHLCDPMAHLRAIAARLSPHGVALIEVPNLLRAAGSSESEILRTLRPFWFTPRALVTACKRAGLAAFRLTVDERLRVWCRKAEPQAVTVPGPSAQDVLAAVHGNDLRLHLKRALLQTGATPRAIAMAATIHRRCSVANTRADLAIEIATACERGSDLDAAAAWLIASLRDRNDSEVRITLANIDRVRERASAVWNALPAANGPMRQVALAS